MYIVIFPADKFYLQYFYYVFHLPPPKKNPFFTQIFHEDMVYGISKKNQVMLKYYVKITVK